MKTNWNGIKWEFGFLFSVHMILLYWIKSNMVKICIITIIIINEIDLNDFLFLSVEEIKWKSVTYLGAATCIGNWSTQRCRNIPSHNWTPTIPNMKNTKKHSNSTLPSMGNVSSKSITRIRIPFCLYSVINEPRFRFILTGIYVSRPKTTPYTARKSIEIL